MTGVKTGVHCEQCGRLALAQLNGYFLCAECIMSFFDDLDDLEATEVDMRPLRPSDTPVVVKREDDTGVNDTLH